MEDGKEMWCGMNWMVISTCCALGVFVKSLHSPRYSCLFMGSKAWVVYFLHSHSASLSNPLHLTIYFSYLESTSSFRVLGVPTTALNKGYKFTNKWCWTGLYDPNPFYPSRT